MKKLEKKIQFVFLLLLISLFSRPVLSQNVKETVAGREPVLYFTFNETAGNLAHNQGSKGQVWDARMGGDAARWSTGLFDGAAELSRKGYLKLPEGVVKDITDFTLSVWIYTYEQADNQTVCTFARGTDQYLILTTQRGNAENGVSLVMTKPAGNGGHTDKEERIAYTRQKEKLSANAWHHIVFTLKGKVGTLYVDGNKVEVKNDFTTNPSLLGYTTDNYIGKPTWPDPYLHGLIDEFRLYDYALTEEQVYRLAAAADPVLVGDDRERLALDDLSAVTANLTLPQTGKSGSRISWSSGDCQYLSDQGIIHRSDAGNGDAEVILTATLQKGKAVATKEFRVVIKDIGVEPEDLHVFSMQTGNPTVPAYLADASFYYDKQTGIFYAYGTNDGAGGGNVYPGQMWYSDDCKNWENKVVEFPRSWVDFAGTEAVWAPSIEYNPDTRKYYLMYSIASKTFVGMASHPLGPWEDANGAAPGKPLFIGYDGQFFRDDDGKMYINTDAWQFKIMKLKFDGKGRIYFDNDDPRFGKTNTNEFVGTYKYAQITEIKNAFEASFIYKKRNLYYLMWSFNGSQDYNVRYAVAENITGPYREINQSMTVPILQRDDHNHILGPGHHSMFDYDGQTFIAYHRQHFPFVDSKRQTCIEEVCFNPDGSIQKITPTHRGVTVVRKTGKDTRTNIALGKQTLTSSAREYDSSEYTRRYRTYGMSFRYAGNFAVDENYGTHWDAGLEARDPWLIVDLGKDCKVEEIETIFEFTSRTYRYKLEYLTQKEAGNLEAASESEAWKMFADKSVDGAPQSPVVDRNPDKSAVKARFVRLTIFSNADIPETADGADRVNADNALSIFELKVFGEDNTNDVNRIFEAECFHNLYGLTIEESLPTGLHIGNGENNDYLLYENIDFGNGAGRFSARVASATIGGRLEIHLDSLIGKPIGIIEIENTGGEQNWTIKSIPLNKKVKGFHKKVYLVFKGDVHVQNLFQLDWFKWDK